MMLAEPGALQPTKHIDVRLQLLKTAKPLKHLSRVHLHAFASETVAQIRLLEGKQLEPGSSMLAQLRPVDPLLLIPGDRFIIRQFSPVITIGGGVVFDSFPLRRATRDLQNARELLERFEVADPSDALALRIERRGSSGLRPEDAIKETGRRRESIDVDVQVLVRDGRLVLAGDVLLSKAAAEQAGRGLLSQVEAFQKANPLTHGIAKETLREKLELNEDVFDYLLAELTAAKKIQVQGEIVGGAGRGLSMSADEERARKTIETAFASAGLKVPLLKEVLAGLSVDRTRSQKIVTLLLREGSLVKLGDELVFHRSALEDLRKKMTAQKSKAAKIDVGQFKDIIGVSRKYAIPLLEYLDRERITRRVGDLREIL
jgi:selenocysteine-specific elongation factor